jgi:hypothetical protein
LRSVLHFAMLSLNTPSVDSSNAEQAVEPPHVSKEPSWLENAGKVLAWLVPTNPPDNHPPDNPPDNPPPKLKFGKRTPVASTKVLKSDIDIEQLRRDYADLNTKFDGKQDICRNLEQQLATAQQQALKYKNKWLQHTESKGLCFQCGEGGFLMVCEGCDAAVHLQCTTLDFVPRGDFFCADCKTDEQSDKSFDFKCSICLKPKNKNAEVIFNSCEHDVKMCSHCAFAWCGTYASQCPLCRGEVQTITQVLTGYSQEVMHRSNLPTPNVSRQSSSASTIIFASPPPTPPNSDEEEMPELEEAPKVEEITKFAAFAIKQEKITKFIAEECIKNKWVRDGNNFHKFDVDIIVEKFDVKLDYIDCFLDSIDQKTGMVRVIIGDVNPKFQFYESDGELKIEFEKYGDMTMSYFPSPPPSPPDEVVQAVKLTNRTMTEVTLILLEDMCKVLKAVPYGAVFFVAKIILLLSRAKATILELKRERDNSNMLWLLRGHREQNAGSPLVLRNELARLRLEQQHSGYVLTNNDKIIDLLMNLDSDIDFTNDRDTFREDMYWTAMYSVFKLGNKETDQITSGKDAAKKCKGIGPKTADKIDEVLSK